MHYISKTNPKNLRGTALLRLDFNTEDDWRMEAALPTIKFLLKYANEVIVLSHKGRPDGFDKKLSLEKDAMRLSKMLGKKYNKKVIVLENLRFMKGEKKNDPHFAEKLASLGDYYVNDAFAVSHRTNASVVAITKFLPSYAGLLMEKEIEQLSGIMKKPKKPFIVILGGAKIGDKLGIVSHFKNKADFFLIGGAPANTLVHLRGVDIGKSMREKKLSSAIRSFVNSKKIVLPVDFRREKGKILDIGPHSEREFKKYIAKARSIIWNGPMGVFEKKKFSYGTKAVARAIFANHKAKIVIGGGETVASLKLLKAKSLKLKANIFISTGGGAMLEFLAGKKLPGIEVLNK